MWHSSSGSDFATVRLNIDPLPMMNGRCQPGLSASAHLGQLDRAVRMFVAADLAVIMDVHPAPRLQASTGRDDRVVSDFAELWRDLASHFAGVDPERLFYGVLNEPEFEVLPVERRAGEACRYDSSGGGAYGHRAGRRWSAVDDLLALEPVADGMSSITPLLRADGVHAPGRRLGSAFWRHLAHDRGGRGDAARPLPRLWLRRYGHERWSASRIAMEIAQVAAWATKHNVRVIVQTSSGCTVRWPIRPIARRGSPTLRVALERHTNRRTMWDYAGDFGVVRRAAWGRIVDAAVISALVLQPTASRGSAGGGGGGRSGTSHRWAG
jgi:hypothetical protein